MYESDLPNDPFSPGEMADLLGQLGQEYNIDFTGEGDTQPLDDLLPEITAPDDRGEEALFKTDDELYLDFPPELPSPEEPPAETEAPEILYNPIPIAENPTELPEALELEAFAADVPTPEEIPEIRAMLSRAMPAIINQHSEFINLDLDDEGPVAAVALERNTQRGKVFFTADSNQVFTVRMAGRDGAKIHTYHIDDEGVVRRYDTVPESSYAGLPQPGEMPIGEYRALLKQRQAEEKEHMKLDQDAGINNLPVGRRELERVLWFALHAEPMTVSFEWLHSIAERRKTSISPPSDEESERAGTEFQEKVRTILQEKGLDPDQAIGLESNVLDTDQGHMKITVGMRQEGSNHTPFLHIDVDRDATSEEIKKALGQDMPVDPALFGGKMRVQLEYATFDGALRCILHHSITNRNGQVIFESEPLPIRGDMLEYRMTRNFMRRPRIWNNSR